MAPLKSIAHGCSAGMDGVMTGTWMLCGNGWNHGWNMDALPEWMESDLDISWSAHGCSAGLDGDGWSLIWTLSWLAHGCSAGMDGV